jgi:phospholipid/cholesterol/gamma-HCH transport system substrate-binding protein
MNITNYTKIALFFVILGVAGGVYIISSTDNLSDFNTREYETAIADATGITTRSKIYQAGVIIGRVKGITLSENEAILRIAIHRDIPVREDAVISRRTSSMLGTSILTLDPGDLYSPIIPPGGRLRSARDTGDIGAVMDTVQGLGEQISDILREFQQNHLALLAISIETFNSIALKIDANTDAELERISRILESVAVITEEISWGRGNIGQAVFDDRLYNNLVSSTEQIEIAVLKLQTTLASINTAATSATTVIDNANEIVVRAVGLGLQVDTFGQYYAQANQVQAGAALRLVPMSNDRWYKIGVSNAPTGISSRTVTETYDPDTGVTTTKDVTQTKHSGFLIDAELARTFGLFTIRGGLIESSGGFGLDINPLRWMGVSGEVFNFRSGEPPNLRGYVTIYPFFDPDSDKPWNWIYIKCGINNSLTSSRDFFIGGGLRFSDREVRGLVGLLPVFGN